MINSMARQSAAQGRAVTWHSTQYTIPMQAYTYACNYLYMDGESIELEMEIDTDRDVLNHACPSGGL